MTTLGLVVLAIMLIVDVVILVWADHRESRHGSLKGLSDG